MTTLNAPAPIERSVAVSCIESRYCSSARVLSLALVTTTATTAAAVTTRARGSGRRTVVAALVGRESWCVVIRHRPKREAYADSEGYKGSPGRGR